ncbi:MAG TPA: hypothetical protein VL551_10600 [Actinospica sp.]|jgi:hypothetical protein|nr:hypothetical protein [Actinospica sp.]
MIQLPASQRLDLRTTDVDDVLSRVQSALQLAMTTQTVVKRRSIGFRSDRGTWVRVECRGLERDGGQGWGLEAARTIVGVPIPAWRAGVSWLDSEREVLWRADETELIDEAPIGRAKSATDLPESWWRAFGSAMDQLSGHITTRVATPDCEPITIERVEAAIRAVYPGAVGVRIDEWATAHADLTWANITGPGLWFLDWEDHGRAPRGLDAAVLWFGSLAVPDVAQRVCRELRCDLDCRTGRVMQLFKCAELLGWAGEDEPLRLPARREADRLLAQLAAEP